MSAAGAAKRPDTKMLALVASLLLVAMPGAPSSFLFLVVRPGAPSSFLLLIAMPGAPSSFLLVFLIIYSFLFHFI